jgi:4-hydroxybenzoate polyprenyltransferase
MVERIRVYLELVKFQHTLFALPFALMGALLGAGGVPPARVLGWVVAAMVGARTAAMAFNRIADRRIDGDNPRTASRALPAGLARPVEAWAMVAGGSALFLLACRELGAWPLALALPVLALAFGYSLTKRFTWTSHLVLGTVLALAPFGGWLATSGTPGGYPWPLSVALVLWVAGFDVLYACLDVDFDRRAGLHSLPARLGPRRALALARLFHLAAFAGFLSAGLDAGLGTAYFAGLALCGVALTIEHLLVRPDDLSRVQLAFFTLNAAISATLFAASWLALGLGA